MPAEADHEPQQFLKDLGAADPEKEETPAWQVHGSKRLLCKYKYPSEDQDAAITLMLNRLRR